MKNKIRLWRLHDALMKRWDAIEEKAEKLFKDTHPWLFNGGTPGIIENEDTIRREKQIEKERTEVYRAMDKVVGELFPPKEYIPPKQERFL